MKVLITYSLLLILLICSCENQNTEVQSVKLIHAKGTTVSLSTNLIEFQLSSPKISALSEVLNSKPVTSLEAKGNFTAYISENGLTMDGVTCSDIDQFGNIWFGSPGGGVVRYDGIHFETFTTSDGLITNYVTTIKVAKNGIIWFVGVRGSLFCYDGQRFYKIDELKSVVVTTLTETSDGVIWGATNKGLYQIKNGKTTVFTKKSGLLSDQINLVYGLENTVWISYKNSNGLSNFSNGKFEHLTPKKEIRFKKTFSLVDDGKGALLIASDLGVIQLKNKKFKLVLGNEEYQNIECLFKDNANRLWFGSRTDGLIHFDGKNSKHYSTDNGLAANEIRSISQDKRGIYWIGTYGAGMVRFDGESCSNYSSKQGLSTSSVISILEKEKGEFWFGTQDAGITIKKGKQFYHVNEGSVFENKIIRGILKAKDQSVWIITNDAGIYQIKNNQLLDYSINSTLPFEQLYTIEEDAEGKIWLGTRNKGVFCLQNNKLINYTKKQGLSSNTIWCIHKAKNGNLWFAGDGGGISVFNGKIIKTYTEKDGLSMNSIWNIKDDKYGTIWLGSDGAGLSRFDGKTFLNFTNSNGIPDNTITQLYSDEASSSVLLGTNKGFSFLSNFTLKSKKILAQNKLDNEQLKNYSPEIKIYNESTGYPIGDVNVGSPNICKDSDGIFWSGTGNNKTSLVRFNPKEIIESKKPTKVRLKSIRLNEKDVCFYLLDKKQNSATIKQQIFRTFKQQLSLQEIKEHTTSFSGVTFEKIRPFYPIPLGLTLPFKNNNISFEFSAIEPSSSDLIEYQYMLEGYDKTWSSIQKKHSATFGNIQEGNYTFKVKAHIIGPNGTHTWSEIEQFHFTVLPPWYRTWWMYTLYVLSSSGCVFFFIKWRTNSLIKNKKILEKIVISRTAEVNEQKLVIENKHKEIRDSINYAERIQRALLTGKKVFDNHLKDYFLIFQPKDIVSGDFYWGHALTNNKYIVFIGDSTGHGVPGAIMSMLNISCLEKVVSKGIQLPNEILNETRNLIIDYMKNDGSETGGRDGMDGSLLCFDFENNLLTCSASMHSICIVRQGTLIEIKGDRMPIGKQEIELQDFTSHTIQLQKGDLVYAYTDGYPDQFGGPNNKKFKQRKLHELFVQIADLPTKEQEQMLISTFTEWKGELEQIDDVCVFGIRI